MQSMDNSELLQAVIAKYRSNASKANLAESEYESCEMYRNVRGDEYRKVMRTHLSQAEENILQLKLTDTVRFLNFLAEQMKKSVFDDDLESLVEVCINGLAQVTAQKLYEYDLGAGWKRYLKKIGPTVAPTKEVIA